MNNLSLRKLLALPVPPLHTHTLPLTGQATGQQRITIREIRLRKASVTPAIMYRGAAASHGNVAYFNPRDSTALYSYKSQQQQWWRLPDCPNMNSALVMAEGRLTTVGGEEYLQPTNSLASLTGEDEDSKWVELFPRMPTARYYLAAVCKGRNVIAAGGWGDGGSVSTVEILNTELRQWSSAASLPHPMIWASIAVCEDLLYLLGGYNQNGRTLSVLTSSITELLHQQQETANQPAVWRRTADAPYYGSTAVSVGGQLLAIGGCEHGKYTSAIVGYDPTSDSWQDMGHMAKPRSGTLVAVLPSNQLIAAGGFGGETKVEIGNVV